MAIRKDIGNVDLGYIANKVTGAVSNISNKIASVINMDSYSKTDPNEVESVELFADESIENIENSIKDNEQYVEKLSKMVDDMGNTLKTLEDKYEFAFSPENNQIWYDNTIIMSNGDKPMTPLDYENNLLGEFSGTYYGENLLEDFANNSEMQDKIKLYTDTYNEIFQKLTNSDQTASEFLNQIASIKNDSLMLNSSVYALKEENEKLAIAKDEQTIINSDEFISWSKNDLTMDELKAKYEEYQNMYLRIYDVPDLAGQLEDFNPMWFCLYAEQLASEQGIDISDVINKQIVVYHEDFSKIYEDYNVMSVEEIKIFSYLYENEGRESALEYLDKKQNELNQRIGMIEAQKEIGELSLDDEGKIKETLGNMLNVGTDGLGDGISSFFSGLENAIINNEKITAKEYKIAYYLQYLNEKSHYLDNIYQVGMSTGNMLPSVTASFLTSLIAPELAPKVGQVLMGVSAYGNSKHEALTNNYSVMTSVIYGLLSAGSEVLTEKMGGVLGIADNPSSSFIMKMFDEGKEEFIQNYLMAGIDAIVLNKPINLDEINSEGLKSFLMGAIVAGNLNLLTSGANGLSFIINNSKVNINSEQINQIAEQISNNPNADIKEIIKKCSKTEAASNIESITDILNSTVLKGYMSFFEQFPAGRNGARQSIVEAVMKVPERANLVLDVINSYFPNMSQEDTIKLATDMNGGITGGICDYAATVNTIMVYFQNNPELFEKTFGYPLTRTNQTGYTLPNDDLLLTDFYCWMNKNNMVESVDGKEVYTPKYKVKLGASYFEGDTVKTIEDYLQSKGLNINTTNKVLYNNYPIAPWQVNNNLSDEEFKPTIIKQIADGLEKGSVLLTLNPTINRLISGDNSIPITPVEFYIPDLNQTTLCAEGHTVSVIGIQDENHILVESWGFICSLDLNDLKNTSISISAVTMNGGN